MFSADALPWWHWPDFARVALVLAAVAAVGALGTLLRRSRPGGGAEPQRADQAGSPASKAPVGSAHQGQRMSTQPSGHEEFPTRASDPVLRFLHRILRLATYVLAVAMVVVVLEGVASVIYTLYLNMSRPPYFMVPNIVQTFGAFLAVLIAYEIFANITLYLRSDVFPVKLVVATAMMAIARKVIILDTDAYTAMDLIGLAAVVLALGITYWLVSQTDAAGHGARWDGDCEDDNR